MRLAFINSNQQERDLGVFENKEQAEAAIAAFLKEHEYHAPYWRVIHFNTKLTYDVGSHSEFFVLYFDNNASAVGVWDEA